MQLRPAPAEPVDIGTSADPGGASSPGISVRAPSAGLPGAGRRASFSLHAVLLASAYAGVGGLLLFYLVDGLSFYQTPLIERPRHDDFWRYKPGGEAGRLFGWIGASMMTLMLAYSLRKRVNFFRHWGPIHIWLDYHILLGLAGPAFIVLHSSFKVGGLVSLSFWSMVAVMVSGILGRYIYRWIPRSGSGEELSYDQARHMDDALADSLRNDWGLTDRALAELESWNETGRRSVASTLLHVAVDPWILRRRLARSPAVSRHVRILPRRRRRQFRRLVLRKILLRRRLLLWDRLRRLFHYWHVFHKPFAVIMYLFMVIHVAVAWSTGYGLLGR